MNVTTDSSWPRANVLGVGVHAENMHSALARVTQAIETRRKGYICLTGVHGIMEAQADAELREILNGAFLNLPDGMPTVWVGRGQGYAEMDRVFGPDLMLEVCRRSVEAGWTHYLYGGGPGVASELADRLRSRFPGIEILGTHCPPFRPLLASEESRLQDELARLRPDILWVGLGTPKQERFMARYGARLDATLLFGVGAAFDYHTGRLRDAPAWMKNSGLQWLHRLAQDPARLWRRYATHNPRFLYLLARHLLGLQHRHLQEEDTHAAS